MSTTQPTPDPTNLFDLEAMPTFSPFRIKKVGSITRKTRDGAREYNMVELTVDPVNYPGKLAIFRMYARVYARIKAVAYLAGEGSAIEATWNSETKSPNFSATIRP